MNIKEIATTLAILGTGSLAAMGCGKEQQPATEVPGGADAAADATDAGEAKCAEGHEGEGHCEGEGAEGEGSCSGEEGEGSCSGEEAAEGGGEAEEAAEGEG